MRAQRRKEFSYNVRLRRVDAEILQDYNTMARYDEIEAEEMREKYTQHREAHASREQSHEETWILELHDRRSGYHE